MYPSKHEDYSPLLESFGDFIEKEVLPTAESIDRNSTYPKEKYGLNFPAGFY